MDARAGARAYARRMARVLERDLVVRRAGPSDDAFIGRLSRLAFSPFDPDAEAHTRRLTHQPGVEIRIAVRGDDRLGFVVVELGRGTAWIQAIAVVAEERGRGVGALLMRSAERVARAAG